MTWRKHFRMVKVPGQAPDRSQSGGSGGSSAKFSSFLPEVYAGHPNRLQRYQQYDDMDRDSVINAALDTISDFCTQTEEQNDSMFKINYQEDANETEVKLIKTFMAKWSKVNNFRSRLWYMFRGVLKNGDAFFLRDPETKEWLWINAFDVELVRVTDEGTKEPAEYIIRNLDYGKQGKFATKPADSQEYLGANGSLGQAASSASPFTRVGNGAGPGLFQMAGTGSGGITGSQQPQSHVVDAKHVVHLSLNAGMDANWPFGTSILEAVFKVFKQKELLEDAVIIYRVQRAPERRIYYIDVGSMNPVMANAHVEKIKNDIHQRRIPNRTGGGNSIMDAAYNPLTMMEDYFFAQSADGRGSKVETLAGGEQTGEIGDLEFFDKKLTAGLRIPAAYMPGGDDNVAFNDGKMGSALIQEFQFNKYCMRLQSLLSPVFDKEFKDFLKANGIQIEDSLFELTFNPPQNFTKYRQIELDLAQMNVYQTVVDNPHLSERFKLIRFANLTEDELLENERMWAEENPDKIKSATGQTAAEETPNDGLGAVGVRSGGLDGMDLGDDGGDGDDADLGDDGGVAPDADGGVDVADLDGGGDEAQ